MNRGYCVPCAPFLYLVPDSGGGTTSGMECLPLGRGSGTPGPFQYIIHEQAKSLQELQNEVAALLEFRDLVIEAIPHLRAKLAAHATSSGSSSTIASPSAIPLPLRRHHHLTSSSGSGLIGVSSSTTNTNTTTTSALVHSTMVTSSSNNSPMATTATSEWEPGIRVRRKLLGKEGKSSVTNSASAAAAVAASTTASSGGYKSADGSGTSSAASSAVQDSGFSTETSSGGAAAAGSGGHTLNNPTGKDRVGGSTNTTDPELLTTMSPSATCTVTDEAEDELWNLLDVIHRKGTRLREEVESLQNRLSSPAEVSDDTSAAAASSGQCPNNLTEATTMRRELSGWLSELNAQLRHLPTPAAHSGHGHLGRLDGIVSSPARLPKLTRDLEVDSTKVRAILLERNPVELQRHLITTSVENQALQLRLDHASKSQLSLLEQLDKAKEESDELRFQLEEKNIELEGTRARMRLLEKARGGGLDSPSPLVSDVSRRDSVLPILALPLPAPGTPVPAEPLASSHDSSSPDTQPAPVSRGSSRQHARKPSKIPLPRRTTPPPPQLPAEDKVMSTVVSDALYRCLDSNRAIGSHSPRFLDSLDLADDCCSSDEQLFDSIASRGDCEGEALASCDSLDQLPW